MMRYASSLFICLLAMPLVFAGFILNARAHHLKKDHTFRAEARRYE